MTILYHKVLCENCEWVGETEELTKEFRCPRCGHKRLIFNPKVSRNVTLEDFMAAS